MLCLAIAALAFVATALFFKNQKHPTSVKNDVVAMKTPAPQPSTQKPEAKPAAVKLTVTDLNLTVKP